MILRPLDFDGPSGHLGQAFHISRDEDSARGHGSSTLCDRLSKMAVSRHGQPKSVHMAPPVGETEQQGILGLAQRSYSAERSCRNVCLARLYSTRASEIHIVIWCSRGRKSTGRKAPGSWLPTVAFCPPKRDRGAASGVFVRWETIGSTISVLITEQNNGQ